MIWRVNGRYRSKVCLILIPPSRSFDWTGSIRCNTMEKAWHWVASKKDTISNTLKLQKEKHLPANSTANSSKPPQNPASTSTMPSTTSSVKSAATTRTWPPHPDRPPRMERPRMSLTPREATRSVDAVGSVLSCKLSLFATRSRGGEKYM